MHDIISMKKHVNDEHHEVVNQMKLEEHNGDRRSKFLKKKRKMSLQVQSHSSFLHPQPQILDNRTSPRI